MSFTLRNQGLLQFSKIIIMLILIIIIIIIIVIIIIIIIVVIIMIIIISPEVLKYRVGIRRGITNRLMSRWGSSALAGSLSSDGVTIKRLVVMQPYTYQPFL